ncbi:hypothetical protein [Geomonas silvestris]|uniref:hypothetical protein n=1 Tax=Geomonas silvestris TaxID=2740184 RepID=UPI00160E44ED|nr:hypothetical protein [Geomonas silvestris]
MKTSSIVSLITVLAAGLTLSGCIFPYWYDDGGRGGGYHDGGGRGGGGHHDGGGRR